VRKNVSSEPAPSVALRDNEKQSQELKKRSVMREFKKRHKAQEAGEAQCWPPMDSLA